MRKLTGVVVAAIIVGGSVSMAQERPQVRVFVAESQAQAFAADRFSATGGSNDQTVEIQKNFQEQEVCQGTRVTNRPERAHFVVTMNRSEGGFSKRAFGFASKDNKIGIRLAGDSSTNTG